MLRYDQLYEDVGRPEKVRLWGKLAYHLATGRPHHGTTVVRIICISVESRWYEKVRLVCLTNIWNLGSHLSFPLPQKPEGGSNRRATAARYIAYNFHCLVDE